MIALLMLARVSRVHVRCALGHRCVARAVPKKPPGSGSSCEMMGVGEFPTQTLARRACRALFLYV